MKKVLTMLVAVAALAAFAGPASAITCTIDHKPAATLLVPYFQVTVSAIANPAPATPVIGPAAGADFSDTFLTVLNASAAPELAHVTVWNKYSIPVLDFNIALSGFDSLSWSMASVLSGNLPNNPASPQSGRGGCDSGAYVKFTGSASSNDSSTSTIYANPVFTDFSFALAAELDGQNLDGTDPCAHGGPGGAGDPPWSSLSSDPDVLTGYVTIDMVNYCTFTNPDEANYYVNDAIGFENALWGDYIFQSGAGVPTYGQPMIALEADVAGVAERLPLETDFLNFQSSASKNIYFPVPVPPVAGTATTRIQGDLNGYRLVTGDDVLRTFYARYWENPTTGGHQTTIAPPGITDPGTSASTAAVNYFATIGLTNPPAGDMREPLGVTYGARYFDDGSGLTSFLRAWRGSSGDFEFLAANKLDPPSLCSTFVEPNVLTVIWDEDENSAGQTGCQVSPCPPGQHFNFPFETQREAIEEFTGLQNHNGWIYVDFADPLANGDGLVTDLDQAWLGYDLQGAAAFANAGIDGVSFDATNCNPVNLDSVGVIAGAPVPANAAGIDPTSNPF
jgi:hypothetical protein